MPRIKPFNPFYLLLVIVGTAFCVTACAYGVSAMRDLRPQKSTPERRVQASTLPAFIEKHGNRLLAGELLVLTLATIGAITTDGYWTRRAVAASQAAAAKANRNTTLETNRPEQSP